MESGIDPGQDYYTQDYYSYEHGFVFHSSELKWHHTYHLRSEGSESQPRPSCFFSRPRGFQPTPVDWHDYKSVKTVSFFPQSRAWSSPWALYEAVLRVRPPAAVLISS